MNEAGHTYQVVIVGGGPVGLFLACCLEHLNIPCRVLEKRKKPITHSRSLGIHPVSLELFHKMDLATSFVKEGLKIFRGVALTGSKQLGTISFEHEALPFNFILSIPQYKTEQLLEQHLKDLNDKALIRGAELSYIKQQRDSVAIIFEKDGAKHQIRSSFLVGCDGKNSSARQHAGIPFKGSTYPDTYIMGDFSDNTSFKNDAAIYLHKDGLIESFPMPGSMRRWVVKTDTFISEPTRETLEKLVAQRISQDLKTQRNSMMSGFGVQKLVAEAFFKKRIILAGDAAHIVSPIGGQGMNLGWLNTWHLAHCLQEILQHKKHPQKRLKEYTSFAKKNTRKVIRRSEINMRLGRKRTFPLLRNALVWMMLNTTMRKVMAKLFTMRKLDKWPI